MKKMILFIMFFTIISKLIGFSREIVLSYYYGISAISDAYLISITVPTVLFSFVISGIVAGYIPTYNSVAIKKGEKSALNFTNNLITSISILNILFIIISWLFAEEIINILASGLKKETYIMTVKFTKISMISIVFTGVLSIISGYLQINKMQIVVSALGIPLNLIVLVSIYLSSKSHTEILPIGYVVATLIQLLFLLIFALRKNFKYKFTLNTKDPALRSIAVMSIPIILGVSVNQINTIVDRTLASRVMEGGISALNYANTLNLFVQGVFVLTIVNLFYPLISKLAAEKKYGEFKIKFIDTTIIMIFCIVPFVCIFIFFSKEIIELLFGRGKFDENAVNYTSNVLKYYSIGMIGFGLRELVVRAFYSMNDSRIPMKNAILSVVINIGLNLSLYKTMGINGLAFSTSISALLTTCLLYYRFNKKYIKIEFKKIIIPSIIFFIISFILIGTARMIYSYTNSNSIIILSSLLIIYIMLYIVLCYLINRKMFDGILNKNNISGGKISENK